jgi:excisionase family DNA binding protein
VDLEQRLEKIEALLCVLVERAQVRDWYTTEEFARLVGRDRFTVREWARQHRIRAAKKRSGRGAYAQWVVSHDELLRYRREGLLPRLQ